MKFNLLIILAAFAMLSCTILGSTPEETVAKYEEAQNSFFEGGYDVSVFEGLISNEMKELMGLISGMQMEQKSIDFGKVICKTEGTLSNCAFSGENGKTESLLLERQGENWIIVGQDGKRITDEDVQMTKALFEQLKTMDTGGNK